MAFKNVNLPESLPLDQFLNEGLGLQSFMQDFLRGGGGGAFLTHYTR